MDSDRAMSTMPHQGGDALGEQACYVFFLPWCDFHSALATFIRRSSSLMGIHDVKAFIAFSKSESRSTSRRACTKAALVACRISSPVGGVVSLSLELMEMAGSAALSPSSRKTSQTRSWAGNGIDRLKRVRYHRVPYAVMSTVSSVYIRDMLVPRVKV